MATALIQFTQGANTDEPGKAVLGDYGDFSAVSVTNGDNADVASWTIYLLDAPGDSVTYPSGSQPQILAVGSNNTPTVTFSPDVAGTYRVMLEVVDVSGSVDRDIRCFGIPDARGFVRPPYQQNPEPLPIALPGIIALDPRPIKPDEQNYGSNVRGWAGNGSVGQLDQFFSQYGDLPAQVVSITPFTATEDDAPLHLVDLGAIGGPAEFNLPVDPRVGFVVRVAVLGLSPDEFTEVTIQATGTVGESGTATLRGDSGSVFVHRGANNWIVLEPSLSSVLRRGNRSGPHDIVMNSSQQVLFMEGEEPYPASPSAVAHYLVNDIQGYNTYYKVGAYRGDLFLYGFSGIGFGTDGSDDNLRINQDGSWSIQNTAHEYRQVLRGVVSNGPPEWGYPILVVGDGGAPEIDAFKVRFPYFDVVSVDGGPEPPGPEVVIKQPIYDEFMGGTDEVISAASTSASVGDLAWNVAVSGTGGEVARAASTEFMSGVYNVQASALGTVAVYLGGHPASDGGVRIGNVKWLEWRGILNAPGMVTDAPAATGEGRCGVGEDSTSAALGNSGLFFQSLPEDSANVFAVARHAGNETIVDTGYLATDVHNYRIHRFGDKAWAFIVDGTTVVTTDTDDPNVPPDVTVLGFMTQSSGSDSDSYNVQVDRFMAPLAY